MKIYQATNTDGFFCLPTQNGGFGIGWSRHEFYEKDSVFFFKGIPPYINLNFEVYADGRESAQTRLLSSPRSINLLFEVSNIHEAVKAKGIETLSPAIVGYLDGWLRVFKQGKAIYLT